MGYCVGLIPSLSGVPEGIPAAAFGQLVANRIRSRNYIDCMYTVIELMSGMSHMTCCSVAVPGVEAWKWGCV
jgi:hypothetical protein